MIAAAAELVARLGRLDDELAAAPHPTCGPASVFIGQIHAGEIFNQYPQEAWLEGTRRWLPGTDPVAVERDFRAPARAARRRTRGTMVTCKWMLIRDAFALDLADPLVAAFQCCHRGDLGGTASLRPQAVRRRRQQLLRAWRASRRSPTARAGGQHTVSEWVDIDDLVRVALLYAATAVEFCA